MRGGSLNLKAIRGWRGEYLDLEAIRGWRGYLDFEAIKGEVTWTSRISGVEGFLGLRS